MLDVDDIDLSKPIILTDAIKMAREFHYRLLEELMVRINNGEEISFEEKASTFRAYEKKIHDIMDGKIPMEELEDLAKQETVRKKVKELSE